jgi:DNA-binding CsgD family transcriptional regulator
MKILNSIFRSPATESILRGGYAIVKNQPNLAPVAFGGSVIAGIVSVLIGGYKIVDCVRYQSASGQCDEAIDKNAPIVTAGFLALVGNWGAFNTYNKKLHEDDVLLPGEKVSARELVIRDPIPFDTGTNYASPVSIDSIAEDIELEISTGKTQQEVADLFNVSRYYVRKALDKARSKKENKNQKENRNKDRGR